MRTVLRCQMRTVLTDSLLFAQSLHSAPLTYPHVQMSASKSCLVFQMYVNVEGASHHIFVYHSETFGSQWNTI
jgi:hypothetical protein